METDDSCRILILGTTSWELRTFGSFRRETNSPMSDRVIRERIDGSAPALCSLGPEGRAMERYRRGKSEQHWTRQFRFITERRLINKTSKTRVTRLAKNKDGNRIHFSLPHSPMIPAADSSFRKSILWEALSGARIPPVGE